MGFAEFYQAGTGNNVNGKFLDLWVGVRLKT